MTGRPVLLLDFDGTITEADSQGLLFDHFLGDRWRGPDAAWRRGEIDAQERSEQQWRMLDVNGAEVIEYLASAVRLSRGTHGLIGAARERGWRVVVLSDGFTLYIRPLLELFGLADLELVANDLDWEVGRAPVVRPLRQNPHCTHCANCKLWVARGLQMEGQRVVMVGDGRADRGAALWADRVFAKAHLAEYCRRWSIPFNPFEDLTDVMEALTRDDWKVAPRSHAPVDVCPDVDPGSLA